ncbi:MAG: T9SS type A sorting domain-containing protein [Ginsengibacter sp.]
MKLTTTLKAIIVMLVCMASFNLKSSATTFTVNVANFQFSVTDIPNVVVGDVIKWVWVSGTHTTTSTAVPAGAGTWDAGISAGSSSFQYTVTIPGTYSYMCSIHPSMTATFTASNVVPVRFSDFNIVNENNKAVLKWITQSEENVDYFSVQKSKTGSDFIEIGKVPAAGHSSIVRSYSYTDLNLSSTDKFYYYVIASVDKNGDKHFSPVQLFRNNVNLSKLILSISPNPISRSGHLMLKFNGDKDGKMDVNVVNLEGKTIIKTTMQVNEGVNNGHLMLENVPAGAYSIIFKLNDTKEVYKLLVK